MKASRCPLCGGRRRDPARPGWQRCGICGLALAKATGEWDLPARTAVMAALARDRGFKSNGHHGAKRANGTGRSLASFPTQPVTLVVLSRFDDPMLVRMRGIAREFSAALFVLDGHSVGTVSDVASVTVHHPLQGDFAAQRNRAQSKLSTPWAFHLDTDERIAPRLARRLGRIAAYADHAGLSAVGFPRANLVDGRRSDLYPDIQYRLVRRDVRFVGRVHERPDACRDWRCTTIVPGAEIEHHLTTGRVSERHAYYDTLGQDRARDADRASLLRPYRG